MATAQSITVGELITRYIKDVELIKPFGLSHLYSLNALSRSALGKIVAADLKPGDVITHCRARRASGACAATVGQDVIYLRGPLSYAAMGMDLPDISIKPVKDALPLLTKLQLIGKSRPRDRRPSNNEFDQLIEFFGKPDPRIKIPMAVMMEFAVWSARRISEITRLKWADLNEVDRTCIVRDMKDPKQKKGNDHEFPLLGRAWDIVMAQPRTHECIFPYNAKSAGQRYTRAKKILGIKNLRFHDLRREAACRLFEMGYGPHEVALVTGHKNWSVLARVYTALKAKDLHSGPAGKKPAADKPHAEDVVDWADRR